MPVKRIMQIVPELPPAVNGLGDYAFLLAHQLRKAHSIDTEFVMFSRDNAGSNVLDGFRVKKIPTRSRAVLAAFLKEAQGSVLLHYVNYAYAKRGCPFWLLEGLKEWKRTVEGARLVTMFHELYASGPVWSSAFWLSSLQRSIAVNLMQLTDACVTSNPIYSEAIKKLSGSKYPRVPAVPIFSNVGEAVPVLSLEKRKRCMVVFGGAANRKRVYARAFEALALSCRQLGIRQILDIGPSVGAKLPVLKDLSIVEMGVLDKQEVSDILATSFSGFLDYPSDFLGKSGIFAAYCAHGVLPINARAGGSVAGGLVAGEHYWTAGRVEPFAMANAQNVADHAHQWYRDHDLVSHGNTFASILKA